MSSSALPPIGDSWDAVCEWVNALSQLAESKSTEAEFLKSFAEAVRNALCAANVSVWRSRRTGPWTCATASGPSDGGSPPDAPAVEAGELDHAAALPDPLILARADQADTALSLIYSDSQTCIVVATTVIDEFTGPTDFRLAFLKQACSLGENYYRRKACENLDDERRRWSELSRFIGELQRCIGISETATYLANEVRKLVSADRVAVVDCRSRRSRVEAVSGVGTVRRSAESVRRLEAAVDQMRVIGQSVRYDATNSRESLPRAAEDACAAYLQEAGSRAADFLPLQVAEDDDGRTKGTVPQITGIVGGMLVVEYFGPHEARATNDALFEALVRHSSIALRNAASHRKLMGAYWLRTKPRASSSLFTRHRYALAAIAAAAVLGALCWLPAPLRIEGRGTMRPTAKRHVYTQVDGIVSEVLVDHGQAVKQDQPLVALHSPQLEIRLTTVLGELQTARKKLAGLQAARVEQSSAPADQRSRRAALAGDEAETANWIESLEKQYAVLEQERENLVVRSPIDGTVITWDVAESLQRRPVAKGDLLLTVARLDDAWELEVFVPEAEIGYLRADKAGARDERRVKFASAAQPGGEFYGDLLDIAASPTRHPEFGHSVKIDVAVRPDPELSRYPGAAVTARIDCGRRSLGFVLFRDVIDWVRQHAFGRF